MVLFVSSSDRKSHSEREKRICHVEFGVDCFVVGDEAWFNGVVCEGVDDGGCGKDAVGCLRGGPVGRCGVDGGELVVVVGEDCSDSAVVGVEVASDDDVCGVVG